MKCGWWFNFAATISCLVGGTLFAGGYADFYYQGKDGNISTPGNWVNSVGIVTDTPTSSLSTRLLFPNPSPSTFLNFTNSYSLAGLSFTADNSFFKIQGLSIETPITLTLGSGGIAVSQASGAKPNGVYFGNINLGLGSDQTWDTSTGSITVDGSLSVSGSLTKIGTGVLKLLQSSPNYSGNLTLSQGTLQISATNALGDTTAKAGTLTLADNTRLEVLGYSANNKLVLPNKITLGNNVTIGSPTMGDFDSAELTLTGSLTTLLKDTVLKTTNRGTLFLTGLISGPESVSTLKFQGTANPNGYGVAVFYDTAILSPTITAITADQTAVVFAANSLTSTTPMLQAINKGVISVAGNSTLGTPINHNTILTWVLSRINPTNFNGILSLDTKPATPTVTFTGAIDLTNFNTSTFTLGSMSTAIIGSGVALTPPGGLSSGVQRFGNGGGRLTVASDMAGAGLSVISDVSSPLTLVLRGNNSALGSTPVVVENSFLVLDNSLALPSTSLVNLGSAGNWGYLSSTTTLAITPADLISKLGTYVSDSIIGFDNPMFASGSITLSGNIDLSAKSVTPYIGTMTGTSTSGGTVARTTQGLTIPGTAIIKPASDHILKFVAVGGRDDGDAEQGTIFLNAPLTTANGVNSVIYGHPAHNVTFGNHDSPGLYVINSSASDYAGGTTINGGEFQLGGSSPFGVGPITITSLAEKVVITPISNQTLGSVTANNSELVLGNSGGINLSIGSLTGSAIVRAVGSVTLTEANTSFNGGFKIDAIGNLIGSNNLSTGNAFISMKGGSIHFEGAATAPVIGNLDGQGYIYLPEGATSITINQYSVSEFSGSICANIGATNTSLIINNQSTSGLMLGASDQYYTGGTVVNNGALAVKAYSGVTKPLGDPSKAVTLNNAQLILEPAGVGCPGPGLPNPITFGTGQKKLAGTGTFLAPGGLTIESGAIISPGAFAAINGQSSSSAGSFKPPLVSQLTFFPAESSNVLTFGNGGGFDVTIQDPGQPAGVGYNTIIVNGKLDITTVTPGTFKFYIITLDQQGLLGPLKNVAGDTTYSLTLVHTTGGITTNGSTVNMAGFSLDLVGYKPSPGIVTTNWSFALGNSGYDIVLNFTPVPEPETWALMLGGSAAVVLPWIRRRSSRKRS
ncbi:MAG: hypothetical protein WC378_08075 [Opitutaceae bacterium]|jgi:autotransporter-associated beta strand protein